MILKPKVLLGQQAMPHQSGERRTVEVSRHFMIVVLFALGLAYVNRLRPLNP